MNTLKIIINKIYGYNLGITCNFQGVNLSSLKGHTTAEVGIEP